MKRFSRLEKTLIVVVLILISVGLFNALNEPLKISCNDTTCSVNFHTLIPGFLERGNVSREFPAEELLGTIEVESEIETETETDSVVEPKTITETFIVTANETIAIESNEQILRGINQAVAQGVTPAIEVSNRSFYGTVLSIYAFSLAIIIILGLYLKRVFGSIFKKSKK